MATPRFSGARRYAEKEQFRPFQEPIPVQVKVQLQFAFLASLRYQEIDWGVAP
jgi:hypothetical protein